MEIMVTDSEIILMQLARCVRSQIHFLFFKFLLKTDSLILSSLTTSPLPPLLQDLLHLPSFQGNPIGGKEILDLEIYPLPLLKV